MSTHDDGDRIDAAIDRAVRQMMSGEPRADLRRRVLARLGAPAPAGGAWWPRVGVAAAAAAALLFAMVNLRPAPFAPEPAPTIAEGPAPAPLHAPEAPSAPAEPPPPSAGVPGRAMEPLGERPATPSPVRPVFGAVSGDRRVTAATVDAPAAAPADAPDATPIEIAPIEIPPLVIQPLVIPPLPVNK